MEKHPGLSCIEMDTVIGRIAGKIIMTFQFTPADFMFGVLLDNKYAAETAKRIEMLKPQLASEAFFFTDVFPVLLTDNGGDFIRVSDFENDVSGNRETILFLCTVELILGMHPFLLFFICFLGIGLTLWHSKPCPFTYWHQCFQSQMSAASASSHTT